MSSNFEKWVDKVGRKFPVISRELSKDGKFVIVRGPSAKEIVKVPVESAIEKTTNFVGAIGEQARFINSLDQGRKA